MSCNLVAGFGRYGEERSASRFMATEEEEMTVV